MEYIAKGWKALKEVDRVIDYCEPMDKRLIPHLKTAKDNFEMALEGDNTNTHARYWLSRLHLKYHVPRKCKVIGATLLVEAAYMGDADAQYELGRNLRIENEGVDTDQQAFYYLEKAADQLEWLKKQLSKRKVLKMSQKKERKIENRSYWCQILIFRWEEVE